MIFHQKHKCLFKNTSQSCHIVIFHEVNHTYCFSDKHPRLMARSEDIENVRLGEESSWLKCFQMKTMASKSRLHANNGSAHICCQEDIFILEVESGGCKRSCQSCLRFCTKLIICLLEAKCILPPVHSRKCHRQGEIL